MAELAELELAGIVEQQTALVTQMEEIVKEEEEEDRFPNEVILEVRAGAGGVKRRCLRRSCKHVSHVRRYARLERSTSCNFARAGRRLQGGFV